MLTEAELLQYIYQTTEMGRDGIQSVLPHAEDVMGSRHAGS